MVLVTNWLVVVDPTCTAMTKAGIFSWTTVGRHIAALSVMKKKASARTNLTGGAIMSCVTVVMRLMIAVVMMKWAPAALLTRCV